MRISQGPYAALSVAEAANAEEVRAAFLHLTKQFHPARFGRMATDVQKLANEVFLGIKLAHDQLTKQLGSSGRPTTRPATGPAAQGTDLNRPATGPGTVRGTGLSPRPGTPPTVQFARGTDRAAPRPSTPLITPSAPRPVSSGPLTRAQTSQQITTQNTRVGTPPVGVPVTTRPTSPMSTLRPGTPPQRPPTASADSINPPTIRYSGVQPTQPLPRGQAAFNESAELQAAMNLLSSKDYSGARAAFHALAAKLPQSRQYRALLCYARGRETQAMGRPDDAVMEFQRALQLDPELEIAKQAIRELGRKSRF